MLTYQVEGDQDPWPSIKKVWTLLFKIVTEYKDTHIITIGGDLNGSLHRHPENDHDKALKNFTTELQLTTPDNYPRSPTFFHHNGKSKSQIDYFLILQHQKNAALTEVKHHGNQPLNTSDHILTEGKIKVEKILKPKKKPRTPATTTYPKPKWEKCDEEV